MKPLPTAAADEAQRQGLQPGDVTELTLDGRCKSTSVQGLGQFTRLTTLSLGNTGLSSLEGFPALGQLRTLLLPDNRLSGGLEHLTACSALEELDLSNNKLASVDALQPLTALKQLNTLDLFACPLEATTPDLREKVFAMLATLQYLNNEDISGKERVREEDDDEEEDVDEEEAQDYEEEGNDDGDDEEEDDDNGEEEYEEEEEEEVVEQADDGEEGEEAGEEYEEAGGDDDDGDDDGDEEEGEEYDEEEPVEVEEGEEEEEEEEDGEDPGTEYLLRGEVDDDEEDYEEESGVKRKREYEEEDEEEEDEDDEE